MPDKLIEQRNRRAERRGQNPQPAPRNAPVKTAEQPFLCTHRSRLPVGKLKCSCKTAPEVYTCDEPAIVSGYSTPEIPQNASDGPLVFRNGEKTDRKFVPYALREGELPRIHEIVCCSSCPLRQEPSAQTVKLWSIGVVGGKPDGTCDILHVCAPEWEGRARMWANSTPEPLTGAFLANSHPDTVAEAIELTAARMVVNHRLTVKAGDMLALAERFPQTKFANVFHGSVNNLFYNQTWPADQLAVLNAAQDRENVFYATPDGRACLDAGWPRCVTWPNSVRLAAFDGPIPVLDPPVLLIAGRLDIVKGFPAAIYAAGIVNRTRPVQVAAVCPARSTALDALAGAARVPLVQHPWLEWEAFQQFVRNSVSVTICPSLTDAYPHIPLDSLAAGRPVVGSPAISYLPEWLTADPNDPEEIAGQVLHLLDGYDQFSAQSRKLAETIQNHNENALLQLFERISNG